MTDNVIPLFDTNPKRAAATGERSFVICPCPDGESIGFAPVVIHDARGALLVSLVCLACQSETPVDANRLGDPLPPLTGEIG